MCVFRGCPAPESPGYIWETPHHVSLSGRESFLPLWKPSQQLTFPAAFSAKARAHTWVWPTRDTRWYTRKEERGEPMLAVGVVTPRFPRLWCSDANNVTIKVAGSVHVSRFPGETWTVIPAAKLFFVPCYPRLLPQPAEHLSDELISFHKIPFC